MQDFSEISGLCLNENKSSVMWLGPIKGSNEPVCGIRAASKLKSLGVYFSATESCINDNVEPVDKKITNVLNVWGQRLLTLKGRRTISKSLVASQLVYLCSAIKIPKKNISTIYSKIMRFLWRGRPPKVAKQILAQSIDDGGLKAVNLELFCKSLHMIWIKRMYCCRQSVWRRILQARIL